MSISVELTTAADLARLFNNAIYKTPSLRPLRSYDPAVHKISFVKCFVYEYSKENGEKAGILVKHFLKGKFTKYNGNDDYVNRKEESSSMIIEVQAGEVRLTDILQAFSH